MQRLILPVVMIGMVPAVSAMAQTDPAARIEKARAAKQTEAKQAKAQAAMERDHAVMMKACREMMSQPK